VEKACFNCGAAMDERSPFCPSCGTAQIRVSSREQSSDALDQPPDSSESPSAQPDRSAYPAGFIPGSASNIHWRQYFRAAWPLALVAGIATGLFPPAGFLLFLPIAVIVSLRFYRKYHSGQIRTGQGALLGAAFSTLSFIVVIIMFVVFYTSNGGELRDMLSKSMNEALARNPNPDAAQMMHSLLNSREGMLALISFMMFIFYCINTVFASLAGALAANFGQDKPKL
jgi:hypothetical protein